MKWLILALAFTVTACHGIILEEPMEVVVARKIAFTNINGDTFTADGTDYLIMNIDGLGMPSTNIQQQKAPYQDGTTFIDALFDNRTITLEVAIIAPNDFATIATKRREVVNKLNPKLGAGTLVYTDEAGNEWKINAIPVTSPAFPNKDYRDPFQRFQVSLLCNDPHWNINAASETLSLPTSATSAELVINAAASSVPTIIRQLDDKFRVAYRRSADGYLVQRTSNNGITWSAESVINAASTLDPCMIQLSNGNFMAAYRRNSDQYIVQRSSADGITWAAEVVINAVFSVKPDLIQQLDGNLRVVYARQADGYIVQKTSPDGTTWSAESTINAANSSTPVLLQKSDGNFVVVYRRASSPFLVQRTSPDGTTWSAESTINTAAATASTILQQSDGSLRVIYRRESDNYIVQRVSADGVTWYAESIINANSSTEPTAVQIDIASFLYVYRRLSDNYLVSVTRTALPVKATTLGDVPTPVKITFTGPATNPRIIKQATLEYIRLNTTLAASDTMAINTAFGKKTITLNQGGITKNGNAFLDLGSTFFQLDSGQLPANLPAGVDIWNGQVGWWPVPADYPEYPDGAAGTTTLSKNFADAQGWTAIDCTLSYANGIMIMTATAANPRVIRTVTASKTVRVKIKRVTGAATFSRIVNSTGTVYTNDKTYPSSGEHIHDFYIGAGATGNINIYGGITGSAIGDVFHISFIYIGDGTYDTLLSDQSGNGKNATVFGATPVDGGFILDGVNDRVIGQAIQSDIYTLSCVYKGISTAADSRLLHIERSTGLLKIELRLSSGVPSFRWTTTALVAAELLSSAGSILDGNDHTIIGVHTGTQAMIYVDGVLRASTVTDTSLTTTIGSFMAIGNNAALSATYTTGTIKHPRIYNRALSQEEITYLYNNPDADYPDSANVVYFEDDSVASTATAVMEWEDRFVGL